MALIEVSVRGPVGYVTLNRPEALNAINDEMDRRLAAAWQQLDDDDAVRVAVLRAVGTRAFCAGADLNAPPTGADGLSFGGGLTGIGGALREFGKPLICAVHGHVLGLGFELAMCADIILAADDAAFALPEARAGVIDHCGIVHRAVRQLPHHMAMAMIVASEPLVAARAFQVGLANEVVARADLDAAVERWVGKVLACSPLVAQAAKEAALTGLRGSLPDALSRRYPRIDRYLSSEDAAEAAQAWAERRPAVWRGR